MSDVSAFVEYVGKAVAMLPDEQAEFISCFKLKKLTKKQFVIQPGFTARHRTYVLTGSLRAFIIDEAGIDHTIQFAVDGWWVSDYNSYIYQKPASMFVAALEDSTVLQIDFETQQHLKASSHTFETFLGLPRNAPRLTISAASSHPLRALPKNAITILWKPTPQQPANCHNTP